MAKNLSTGAANFIAAHGSLKHCAATTRALCISGLQPATADTASTGTILATLTKGGGAFTAETQALWKATVGGTATGAVQGLVLGSLILGDTSQSGGSTTTCKLNAGASATDDFYNGMYLLITSSTYAGYIVRITDYVGSTKVATFTPALAGAPDSATFQVVAGVKLNAAAVDFLTDIPTTVANLVTDIQNTITYPDLEAYQSTNDIYIKAPRGIGSIFNGYRLYGGGTGSTTITATALPTTPGVDSANGVSWVGPASGGVIAKESTAMQGNGAVAGTIGFIRLCFDGDDDGLSASTTYRRLDLTVGVGSGDVQLSSLTTAVGAPIIISTFPLSVLLTSV